MTDNQLSQVAKNLEATQMGWLDENILSELVLITTSYPSNHKYFRIYDFWITIKEGVCVEDKFVLKHKSEILAKLKLINDELVRAGIGKMLYVELTQPGVIGLLKVYEPVDANNQIVEDLIQAHVDELADKYADYTIYPKKVHWEFVLHK